MASNKAPESPRKKDSQLKWFNTMKKRVENAGKLCAALCCAVLSLE